MISLFYYLKPIQEWVKIYYTATLWILCAIDIVLIMRESRTKVFLGIRLVRPTEYTLMIPLTYLFQDMSVPISIYESKGVSCLNQFPLYKCVNIISTL